MYLGKLYFGWVSVVSDCTGEYLVNGHLLQCCYTSKTNIICICNTSSIQMDIETVKQRTRERERKSQRKTKQKYSHSFIYIDKQSSHILHTHVPYQNDECIQHTISRSSVPISKHKHTTSKKHNKWTGATTANNISIDWNKPIIW